MNGMNERKKTCYMQSLVNGVCTVTDTSVVYERETIIPQKITKERSMIFDVNIAQSFSEKTETREDTKLFNGVLFGSNEIIFDVDSFVKSMEFEVSSSNDYGALNVYMNGTLLFSQDAKSGKYKIDVNKVTKGELRIVASTSGWKMWAPALYGIKNIKLTTVESDTKANEINFVLNEKEYNGLLSSVIESMPQRVTILVNDHKTEGNNVDRAFFDLGDNKIVFLPDPQTSFSGKVSLKIKWEEEV